jgi:hypothetical protein
LIAIVLGRVGIRSQPGKARRSVRRHRVGEIA